MGAWPAVRWAAGGYAQSGDKTARAVRRLAGASARGDPGVRGRGNAQLYSEKEVSRGSSPFYLQRADVVVAVLVPASACLLPYVPHPPPEPRAPDAFLFIPSAPSP